MLSGDQWLWGGQRHENLITQKSLVLEAFLSSFSCETNSLCQSCRLGSGSQAKWGQGLTMSPFWPGAHYSPDWASSSRQLPCLWLPSTRITSIDQHSQFQLNFCIPCPYHSSPPVTLPVALPQGHFPSSSLTLGPVVPREGSWLDFLHYVSFPPSPSCSLRQFYYAEFLRMSLSC